MSKVRQAGLIAAAALGLALLLLPIGSTPWADQFRARIIRRAEVYNRTHPAPAHPGAAVRASLPAIRRRIGHAFQGTLLLVGVPGVGTATLLALTRRRTARSPSPS